MWRTNDSGMGSKSIQRCLVPSIDLSAILRIHTIESLRKKTRALRLNMVVSRWKFIAAHTAKLTLEGLLLCALLVLLLHR